MLSHFTYLKDAGFNFLAPVQIMIILCKLPPTMEVVAQILSQMSPDEIKNLKPEGIVKAATLSFEQKGATHGGGKGPQANKLSAVKRKPADPKFAQQQQQQPQRQQQGSKAGPMVVRAETLLPKDREAALVVVARRLTLTMKMPSKLPSLLMSTMMDLSPPSTLAPWPTPPVLPTLAPRI